MGLNSSFHMVVLFLLESKMTHKENDPLGKRQLRINKQNVDEQNSETVEERQDTHRHEILREPGETPRVESTRLLARRLVPRDICDELVERNVHCFEVLGSERVVEFETHFSGHVVRCCAREGVVVWDVCETSSNGEG